MPGDHMHDTNPTADFSQFYGRSYRRVLAIAVASTGSWADAEEIVQDAYADAHRRWSAIAGYDEPVAFVIRAVQNRCASRWRRRTREVRAITRLSHRAQDQPPADESFDREFWSAVAQLPAQQSKAIALYYVADLSLAEVATHLGCSQGSAKSHLSRARISLRAMLQADQTTGGSDG